MSLMTSFSRGIAMLSMLATGAIMALPASAQDTYDWLGSGDANNREWAINTPLMNQNAGAWNINAAPSTDAPGSSLNSAGNVNDVVNITKTRTAGGFETIRLDQDAGFVGTVQIGGNNGLVSGDEARLQMFGTMGNINIGTLILGRGGGNSNPGRLQVNNNTSSATVGTVDSGSLDTVNRIEVNQQAGGGLTIAGNIDTVGTGGIGSNPAGLTSWSNAAERQIDLQLQSNDTNVTNPNRFVLGTGGQSLSLDGFIVGTAFNNTNDGAFTINDNNIVESNSVQIGVANNNTMNGTMVAMGTGTVTVNGGAALRNYGGNGENGTIQVANANSPVAIGAMADGTLNIGDGSVYTSNVILAGNMSTNVNVPVTQTSTGAINLTDAAAVLDVGRIDNNNMGAGQIRLGSSNMGDGNLTLDAGTVNTYGVSYVAGDSNQGTDRSTTGSLTINGGTYNAGASNGTVGPFGSPGLASEFNYQGGARDTTIEVGSANIEVGRDGTGTMTVNGGLVNLYRGNLILGQSGPAGQNNVLDPDGDGTNTNRLNGLANVDWRGTNNAPLIDTSATGLNVDYELQGTGPNYVLTAAGLAKVNINSARGTYSQTSGVVNVGFTQGADLDIASPVELYNDLNFQSGGGDANLSGGTLNIERNLNMGGVANGAGTLDDGNPNARNSLTVSGNAILNIGQAIAGVTDGVLLANQGNLGGQASDVTIVGGGTNINIADDLILSGGANGTDLTFDFGGAAINSFNLVVGDNAQLAGELFLTNIGALSADFGDILLIDAARNRNGADTADAFFANVDEGDLFGTYAFTYALGGAAGQIGLTAVPEPSSLAILGLGCIGLVARRRRRS